MTDQVTASTEPRDRRAFGLTWDYRCPFARNMHEHVVAGLEAGASWAVSFIPFSLNQVHVKEREPDVWDDPKRARDLLAMQVGIAIRDGWPEHFLRAHIALFAARHDRGMDLRDEQVLATILKELGLPPETVLDKARGGEPLETFRSQHETAATEHSVFGVPTLIVDDRAVFVRIMDRPGDDGNRAKGTIDRLLDLVGGWPELNEFKYTQIPR
jgi:hypothetical protein